MVQVPTLVTPPKLVNMRFNSVADSVLNVDVLVEYFKLRRGFTRVALRSSVSPVNVLCKGPLDACVSPVMLLGNLNPSGR